MKPMWHLLRKLVPWLLVSSFAASVCAQAHAADLGVAGVPVGLGKTRDYDAIFKTLRGAGITVFFPTFQYVEQPVAKTLGFESDFVAPCSADSPAFRALRHNGMQLVVPGELIYPRGEPLPPLGSDPLRQIIECAGRDGIYGVLSYDEPISGGASLEDVSALFDRIKAIDNTLPVLMVHAPIIVDMPQFATAGGIQAYLEKVAIYSRFADVVGFDVYPVVKHIAKVGTPSSAGKMVDYETAIKDYMKWLRQSIPDRRYMMVLQGFSYADQYDPNFLLQVAPPEILATVRPPNAQETSDMAKLSIEGGAQLIIWWGLSLQKDETTQVWRDILQASQANTARP